MSPGTQQPRALPARWMVLSALVGITLVAGCASTASLVDVWKDPHHPSQPVRHVLVIAMRPNAIERRLWEDGFVAELNRHGVETVASYEAFPVAFPDTQKIEPYVREQGFDAVLMIRAIPSTVRREYVPGYVTTIPVTRRDPWTGAYFTHFRDVYRRGYVETERVVRNTVELWTTGPEGRMVWAGTGESINPSSENAVRREISRLIMPEFERTGLIASHS